MAEAKKSDLGVRTASAVVMVAVAVGAFWLGEWAIRALVVIACLAMLWEWQSLVTKMPYQGLSQFLWRLSGLLYIGFAAWLLWLNPYLVVILPVVWAIDIFAYFFGRTLGGPKIAPAISPSKTWAGLLGGIVGATVTIWLAFNYLEPGGPIQVSFLSSLIIGFFAAVAAQAGDFFESWMKRKAGVKDSSNLIPGHGGVFDRLDGALPIIIIAGIYGIGLL